MPLSGALESASLADQAAAPPAGLWDVSTFPELSVAAQKLLVGHEIPFSCGVAEAASIATGLAQALAPPPGSLDVIRFPAPSTMAQKPVVGHDSAVGTALGSIVADAQLDAWAGEAAAPRPIAVTASDIATHARPVRLNMLTPLPVGR